MQFYRFEFLLWHFKKKRGGWIVMITTRNHFLYDFLYEYENGGLMLSFKS